MWNNPEAWIAIGVSVGFVVAGVVMHRVFVNILKMSRQMTITMCRLSAKRKPSHE